MISTKRLCTSATLCLLATSSSILVQHIAAMAAQPVARPAAAKPAAPKAPIKLREKWAVLIGINQYQDKSIGQVKYAGRNVAAITRTLADTNAGRFSPDHIMVITDGKATKQNISSCLFEDWLPKKALPNDLILVYFCGRLLEADNHNDVLLVPYEGQAATKENTTLSLSGALNEIKRRTQSKNIICLLDATALNATDMKADDSALKKLQADAGVSIFAADQRLAKSAVDETAMHSVFASNLVEGLKTGGGQLPFATVIDFVDNAIKSQAPDQTAAFLPATDNTDIGSTIIGQPIKQPFNIANVKMGHPIEKLDPDMQRQAERMQEDIDKVQAKKADKANGLEDDDDDDVQDVDFGPYMTQMKKSIQAKWVSPKLTKGKNAVAVFSIQRDGRITDAELAESSGNTEVDTSAMAALKAASPLAPLPKGSPKHVQIRYKFEWKVSEVQ